MQYDVVIIGSGVAGLTAGIYSARGGLKAVILENSALGGTTATLASIENYPGYLGKSGSELVQSMITQVVNLSIPIEFESIKEINYKDKVIYTENGQELTYKALIIATGNSYKTLGLKSEQSLKFKGVSYCAVCDGNLYRGKKIVVVTSGEIGKESIEYLSNLTNDITILDISSIYRNKQNKVYSNVEVKEILGADYVEGIQFNSDGKEYSLECQAVFVCLGKHSDTRLFDSCIKLNNGKIITDEDMKTNIDGVYAVGDIRDKKLRQVVTACADGAIAGTEVIKYINGLKA